MVLGNLTAWNAENAKGEDGTAKYAKYANGLNWSCYERIQGTQRIILAADGHG